MKVSFPIKFRLLGNGQKVGATDRESFSVYQEGKKKSIPLSSAPLSPSNRAVLSRTAVMRAALMYLPRCGLGSGSIK